MKMGKKYAESAKLIDKTKLYDANEALDIVCQTAKAKFDEVKQKLVKDGLYEAFDLGCVWLEKMLVS